MILSSAISLRARELPPSHPYLYKYSALLTKADWPSDKRSRYGVKGEGVFRSKIIWNIKNLKILSLSMYFKSIFKKQYYSKHKNADYWNTPWFVTWSLFQLIVKYVIKYQALATYYCVRLTESVLFAGWNARASSKRCNLPID